MKISQWFVVLLAMAGMGCVHAVSFEGESRAGETLRSDITKNLLLQTKALSKCDRIDTIQTQVLQTHPVGTGATDAARKYGSVDERWVLNFCGLSKPYLVTLTPDGEGGTFFSLVAEQVSAVQDGPSAFAMHGERLDHPVPQGWKLAWMNGTPDGQFFVEYIPESQSIQTWREGYLLIERIPYPPKYVMDQIAKANSTVADVALYQFMKRVSDGCAGQHEGKAPEAISVNGLRFMMGMGYCSAFGKAAPFGEGSQFAFVEGHDFFFKIQYGWRPASQQEQGINLPWRIDAATLARNEQAIRATTLCGGAGQPDCKSYGTP